MNKDHFCCYCITGKDHLVNWKKCCLCGQKMPIFGSRG